MNYKNLHFRKVTFLVIFLLVSLSSFSQYRSDRFDEYIKTYKDLAIYQMAKYKIPASITLSQAILESSAGTSHLAVYGNNHFGIKKKESWHGETIVNPNDGELYRKYETIATSYNDHSLFLTQRPWYKPLFNLSITDYRGWANGLSKAGYATDKAYATKLIRLIETYELYLYDRELLAEKY